MPINTAVEKKIATQNRSRYPVSDYNCQKIEKKLSHGEFRLVYVVYILGTRKSNCDGDLFTVYTGMLTYPQPQA